MLQKVRFLNSNAIKFIAAFAMLVDHVGCMFFDDLAWRIIGRIAMPLFAFGLPRAATTPKISSSTF